MSHGLTRYFVSNEELSLKSKSEYKVFSWDSGETHLFFVVLVEIRCESPFVQHSDVIQNRNGLLPEHVGSCLEDTLGKSR